jgi:hypothetical protein
MADVWLYEFYMIRVASSPFYRFQGWRFVALFLVFTLYTAWYVGPGYFGQLTHLEGYSLLQARGFYTGAEAKAAIAGLSAEGRRLKYLALIFDVPYMILQALVFEAGIAFGILQARLSSRYWQWLFVLPIGFLLADVLEDSALALLLSTDHIVFGAAAGVFTAIKFFVFIPAIIVSIVMLLLGVFASLRRKGGRP